MEYVENTRYPMSEYDNITQWWQDHKDYDINVLVDDEGEYIEISKRSDEQVLEDLRMKREKECFPYINRGQLWYDTLTQEQKEEFMQWYQDWLNVTKTLKEPTKPEWLK